MLTIKLPQSVFLKNVKALAVTNVSYLKIYILEFISNNFMTPNFYLWNYIITANQVSYLLMILCPLEIFSKDYAFKGVS